LKRLPMRASGRRPTTTPLPHSFRLNGAPVLGIAADADVFASISSAGSRYIRSIGTVYARRCSPRLNAFVLAPAVPDPSCDKSRRTFTPPADIEHAAEGPSFGCPAAARERPFPVARARPNYG
jgi:hypothetical protein